MNTKIWETLRVSDFSVLQSQNYRQADQPSKLTMRSICCSSVFPGRRGLWDSNSPKIHPVLHMSMEVVCWLSPNRSSGLRYHRVTTLGVNWGGKGTEKALASPKSAIFRTPLSVRRRLDTFKSRWIMKEECRWDSPLNTWKFIMHSDKWYQVT